jgi:hypothetical protein
MRMSYDDFTQSRTDKGPAIYYGYCRRSRRFRMMDLPEYVENVQQGVAGWVNDTQSTYQEIARGYGIPQSGRRDDIRGGKHRDGGCGDCHCECCICDTDVLIHSRCGETRRIPIT